MTDKINEEPQDAPAVVINAPDQIWLTFGDLSEFNGSHIEYADASRASDVSWCEEQIETSDLKYIRADLVNQRQQQPAVEAASVPAELVEIFAADCEIARRHNAPSEFWGFWPALQDFANKCAAYGRGQSQPAGQCCPMCGSPEVDHNGPQTKYECGSSDYDQRPGTFREAERCNRIRLRIPLPPEPPTC